MTDSSWIDTLRLSLYNVWYTVLHFLPGIAGALIVFLVGLIIASFLASIIERVLKAAKFDTYLSRAGVADYVERAGLELNVGRFIGMLVYWFVLIAFLLASLDILGLNRLSDFLQSDVLSYIPQVVVAVLIMLIAVLVGNFLKSLVYASLKGAGMGAAPFLASLSWWSVVVFGFFAALIQLGIMREIILTLVTGLIAMFALAGGLAFGLGGRDFAARLLKRFEDEMMGKR